MDERFHVIFHFFARWWRDFEIFCHHRTGITFQPFNALLDDAVGLTHFFDADQITVVAVALYTDGNIKIATDAIQAAAGGHHFLSVHKNGQVAIVQTHGNPDCHVILRGGKAPNYDAASVEAACQDLVKAKLPATLMVDCSHANSSKQHEKQLEVAKDIASQITGGSTSVFGVMVESHLTAGAQKFTPGKDDASKLAYGQSITDACLGWDDSLASLDVLSQAVLARRAR